jgi:hypothetical protein
MSFLLIPIQIFPNSGFGARALENASGSIDNVGIGTNALRQVNNVGNSNVGIGAYAGERLTSNNGNVIVGSEALKFSTSDYSVAIGFQALKGDALNFGFHSSTVAIGNEAMGEAFAGVSNTAIGNRAIRRVSSSENVAIGADAGINIFRSEKNTLIGSGSGFSHFRGTTINGVNTFVGWNSGYFVTSGIKNTILGAFNGNQNGLDIRTLSNHIVLSDGDGNPRLWINDTGAVNIPGGIALTGSLFITGGTVTANNPVLSATQTWNNAAVTFTGWQLNVTDTASNGNSLLMDLQVGGSSQMSISKSGTLTVGNSAGVGGLRITNSGGTQPLMQRNAADGGIIITTTSGPNNVWINGPSGVGVAITTDAANVLAQRAGVNAQTFNIYNTFTDASNFERGFIGWSASVLQIGTTGNGTGVPDRDVEISTGSVTRWIFKGAGNFLAGGDNLYDIGSAGANRPRNAFWAGYQQMSEMTAPAAPAANSVRIYAEDNGSGKTRLMALFATGAAQQIAIEP